jgi:hypothetical protein
MTRYLLPVVAILLAACTPEESAQSPAEGAQFSPVILEAAGGNPAAEAAANEITDPYMREIIAEISDDAYEGRGPGSRGDEMTRRYLIDRMQEIGLEPGGVDGSYEQPFELVGINATQPDSWTFSGKDRDLTLAQWDDFIISSGRQEDRIDVADAEVVFVGYGMQAPEYDWDDFKDADLDGKVLLIMNNDPDWDPELFEGETRLWYGRWDYKYMMAAKMGAAGAIIIHTTPSASYPFQVVQTSWTGVQYELPAGDEPRTQFNGWITEDKARELVAMAGYAAAIRSFRTRSLSTRHITITSGSAHRMRPATRFTTVPSIMHRVSHSSWGSAKR